MPAGGPSSLSHLFSSVISADGRRKSIVSGEKFQRVYGWDSARQAAPGFWLSLLDEESRESYLDALGRAVREGWASLQYSFADASGRRHDIHEYFQREAPSPNVEPAIGSVFVAGRDSTAGLFRFRDEIWNAWACAGHDFFAQALAALTAASHADHAFLGEIEASPNGPVLQTFAVRTDGRSAENFSFPLAGSPFEQALHGQVCFQDSGTAATCSAHPLVPAEEWSAYYCYPLKDAAGQPLGLLALLFREPCPEIERLGGMVELIASRTSLEFERLREQRRLTESEERFREIAETIQDGFWVLDAARERLSYASPAFLRIWDGAMETPFAHAPWRVLLTTQASLLHKTPLTREFQITLADGSTRWIRDRSFPASGASGERGRVIGVCRDVTDEKLGLEAIWESQQLVLTVANALPALLYLWDIEDGRVTLLNQYSREMFQTGEEDAACDPAAAIHPSDLVKLRVIRRQLAGGGGPVNTSFRLRQPDGGYRWFSGREAVFQRGLSGGAKQILGVAHDISENIRLEQELLFSALHDRQTSLPNRVLFEERLEQAARRSQRDPGQVIGVLLLDLDRFRRINDGLGHKAGDAVLVALARRLELCVREGDTVARFGSDEFGVLIEGLQSPAEAHLVAGRLLATVGQPVDGQPQEVLISASIGISISHSSGADPHEMLREAEMALSSAKRGGRGCYRVFDAAEHSGTAGRLRLESELRAAYHSNQFELLYQPICRVDDGSVAGFECLLRWRHPERGLLSPADFLDHAWEAGLMERVSGWVLRTACERLSEWLRINPGIYLSVNIDGRQFAQPDFFEHIDTELNATRLPPMALHLEITETAISANLEEAAAVLRLLKARGAGIMLDDFGIGFSSLSRLSRLPIDALKIDRSFLESNGGNTTDPVVLRAMLTLARDLNMRTIVEGVESEAQMRLLREANCQYAQGYYLYQPMHQEEAERLLGCQTAVG